MGITTKTIPLLAVPASALELRDGTWLMTGSCVMKDAVMVKENYGHSLDRLQVALFFFCSLYVYRGKFRFRQILFVVLKRFHMTTNLYS